MKGGVTAGRNYVVWLLGLALCFAIGFWPWILGQVGVSMILGALAAYVVDGLSRGLTPTYPPYRGPSQPERPYRQGYQQPQQAAGTPQESEQQRAYTETGRRGQL